MLALCARALAVGQAALMWPLKDRGLRVDLAVGAASSLRPGDEAL